MKANATKSDSILGFLISRFLLTLVYYIVIVPLAWGAKLLGKTWMPLTADTTQSSYWNQRDRQPTSTDRFEKQS